MKQEKTQAQGVRKKKEIFLFYASATSCTHPFFPIALASASTLAFASQV